MSSLFTSLHSSSDSLSVFERALSVTSNNVNNAATPGYARQRLVLEAMPFDPEQGLGGGVTAGAIESMRSRSADLDVRQKTTSQGYFDQRVASLQSIETGFDISGRGGIDGALNELFQSFSAWSVTPGSLPLRQNVMASAGRAAQAFQQAAADLSKQLASTHQQIGATVDEINRLAGKLQEYNAERLRNGSFDPGLDAKIHSTLDQLSELADIQALDQPDGSVTVLLGGQTPLVVGDRQYPISVDLQNTDGPPPVNPGAPVPARIVSADGRDVTGEITSGKLGALLDISNQQIPALAGDAYQNGSLNQLAKAFADRVNQILSSGLVADGPPPQPGIPLFTYQPDNGAGIAASLAVNPAAHAENLAAIDPGPPYTANGIALRLAGLATSTHAEDQIDGQSYIDFYGSMAEQLGGALAGSKDSLDIARQMVAQAQTMREKIAGVSLDEEAVHLIEFQRSYQATARMIGVLNDLTQTAVDLLR